jgi:hypothetical protein
VLNKGNLQSNTASAITCAADSRTAYAQAKGAVCLPKNKQVLAEIGGNTYFPGVHCSAPGYFTFSTGAVTLDGQGNSNSVWVFQAATTLTSHAGTHFVLVYANSIYAISIIL